MLRHELAHPPLPAIAQMGDLIDLPVAVLEVDQVADDFENILAPKRPLLEWNVELELMLELEPPDFRKIVALRVEKKIVEERGGRLQRRRGGGTHEGIDLHRRLFRRNGFVLRERAPERPASRALLRRYDLHRLDAV